MGVQPTTSVFCAAGRWTQIIWAWPGSYILNYDVSIGPISASWRRFSGGPPHYWQGGFAGTTRFTLWPGDVYVSIELNPSTDVTAAITLPS